jgi:hypothetical protein
MAIVAGCLGRPATVQEMVDFVQREGIEAHKTMYRREEVGKLWQQQQALGRRGKKKKKDASFLARAGCLATYIGYVSRVSVHLC